jgi:hypothetical protein
MVQLPPTLAPRLAGLLTALALGALPPGVGHAPASTPPARAAWTVMVFISGDNDLEPFVVQDLEQELAAVGSGPDVQVVALADRGPGYDRRRGDWQNTLLFHVTRGMQATPQAAVADWGERNMGDPRTLIDFVTWAKANLPAERYALYFWGHGWNWHPGWVMQDDTDGDTLDMHELEAALPALGYLDLIGYDGCNMASAEVLELWHGHATAVAASQEFVGWEGVEYDRVLTALAANPGMNADAAAIAASRSTRGTHERTWSAVAVDARWQVLEDAIAAWSDALLAGLPAHRAEYDAAFRATQSFIQDPIDLDLADLATQMERAVNDPRVRLRSRAVRQAVDALVLDERHTTAYPGAHGISIYLIPDARAKRPTDFGYYRRLGFSRATGWDDFIAAYAD